jgi:hypothetical protein
MVTPRTAKRLQRILTCYVCVIPGCVFRNKRLQLRPCHKIFREQAWQCHAGNAKWPDNF